MATTGSAEAISELQSTAQAAGTAAAAAPGAAAAAPLTPQPPAAGPSQGSPGSPFLKRARLGAGVRLNLSRFSRKLINTFGMMDKDGSGKLSHTEFFAGLAAANIVMSTSEFDQLTRLLDRTGDGLVDFNELVEGLYLLSTEHEAKVDKQFMAGGEVLELQVQPPVSAGAAEAGIWPIASAAPQINRERRAGIVTPWAERAATSMKGLTATEWAQRRRRQQQKSGVEEDADYRWPAPVPTSKRPKPYALPRSASPRSRPWSPRVGAAEINAATATARSQRASSARPQTTPKPAPTSARPVSRGEKAAMKRAQFYASVLAQEQAAIEAEKQRLASIHHPSRSDSPYSLTKGHKKLSQELSNLSNRITPPRPKTAPTSQDIARILDDGPKTKTPGALSPRLSSPIGIYLPSACGPAPPLKVPLPSPGKGSRVKSRRSDNGKPRSASTRTQRIDEVLGVRPLSATSRAAQTVTMALPPAAEKEEALAVAPPETPKAVAPEPPAAATAEE